jgi:hypothetical protein
VVLVAAGEEVAAKGVFSARREGVARGVPSGTGLAGGVCGGGGGARGGRRADAGQGPHGRSGRMRCGATRLEGIPEEDATMGLCGWCRCECDDDGWEVVGGGGAGGRDGDGAVGDGGGRVGRVPRRWPPRFPSVWGRWGIACGRQRRGHGRARRPHSILN